MICFTFILLFKFNSFEHLNFNPITFKNSKNLSQFKNPNISHFKPKVVYKLNGERHGRSAMAREKLHKLR